MLEVTVLASGSSGNALLVRTASLRVLVDAGLSARKLQGLLAACSTEPSGLAGILLTHEHGDHARGLRVFVEKHGTPVFANPLTAHHLKSSGVTAHWNLFSSGSRFSLGDLEILPFSVPHDAADPVGFVLQSNGTSFAVLTDLGYATRQVVESVRGVHALLIETNHDEGLLQQDTKRPWSVKQRILSRHGHLSNSAAAEVVEAVATPNLRHVLLGHLSRDCNSRELATAAIAARLSAHPTTTISCTCPDDEPLRVEI